MNNTMNNTLDNIVYKSRAALARDVAADPASYCYHIAKKHYEAVRGAYRENMKDPALKASHATACWYLIQAEKDLPQEWLLYSNRHGKPTHAIAMWGVVGDADEMRAALRLVQARRAVVWTMTQREVDTLYEGGSNLTVEYFADMP